jgi:hypothetical protein
MHVRKPDRMQDDMLSGKRADLMVGCLIVWLARNHASLLAVIPSC